MREKVLVITQWLVREKLQPSCDSEYVLVTQSAIEQVLAQQEPDFEIVQATSSISQGDIERSTLVTTILLRWK